MEIKEVGIGEYLDRLSSKEAIPGGGGASAMAAAYGVSLGLMVGNLTLGKKKYEEYSEKIQYCMEKLKNLQELFLTLSKADEEAFLPLSKAYSLPKDGEEEKRIREETLERCLMNACEPPIKVMEKSCEALNYMQELAEHGSRLAVSDVGVGVQFLNTAISGAIMNVYINAKLLKDRDKANELVRYAEDLMEDGTHKVYEIYELVEQSVRG